MYFLNRLKKLVLSACEKLPNFFSRWPLRKKIISSLQSVFKHLRTKHWSYFFDFFAQISFRAIFAKSLSVYFFCLHRKNLLFYVISLPDWKKHVFSACDKLPNFFSRWPLQKNNYSITPKCLKTFQNKTLELLFRFFSSIENYSPFSKKFVCLLFRNIRNSISTYFLTRQSRL